MYTSVWHSALAITRTRTSPALGGSTVIVSMLRGCLGARATAALHWMGLGVSCALGIRGADAVARVGGWLAAAAAFAAAFALSAAEWCAMCSPIYVEMVK